MFRSSQLIALIAAALVATPTFATNSVQICIKELAKSSAQLVGKSVTTHGCLVNSPHGSFIEPCGSKDWHDLTLIYDPSYKVSEAFDDLGIDFSYNVEGDFSGVIIEKMVTFSKTGKRFFLRLDSVANASPYEP